MFRWLKPTEIRYLINTFFYNLDGFEKKGQLVIPAYSILPAYKIYSGKYKDTRNYFQDSKAVFAQNDGNNPGYKGLRININTYRWGLNMS